MAYGPERQYGTHQWKKEVSRATRGNRLAAALADATDDDAGADEVSAYGLDDECDDCRPAGPIATATVRCSDHTLP